MNRAELVNVVTAAGSLTRVDVDAVVTATLEAIITATAAGEKVVLAGFGTFEVRDRAAREGRNPQTGATLQIAASRTAGFKPAAAFKDKLN